MKHDQELGATNILMHVPLAAAVLSGPFVASNVTSAVVVDCPIGN